MKKDNGRDLKALARKGRGGDTEIGHLTEGELVVPVSILDRFPEARDVLFDAFREAGIDPDRYIVGAAENSVNPETGVREFGFEGYNGSAGDFDGSDARNQGQGPESQDAGGRDNDPSDRNRYRSGGGGQMTLPAEYADFILEDGRRLEDVLGKSFFKGGGKLGRFGLFGRKGKRDKDGVHARVLAERQAQARRLNQTKSILTSAQGVAGAANTSKGQLSGG
jgi:hypothetical protein